MRIWTPLPRSRATWPPTVLACGVIRTASTAASAGPKPLARPLPGSTRCRLLWSQQAAQSHFVEFEWTTALALQKPVLLCHLDSTPLPPALQALHSIPGHAGEATLRSLLEALPTLPRLASVGRQQEVLAALPPPRHLSTRATDAGPA